MDYDKEIQKLAEGPETEVAFKVGDQVVERNKMVSLTINFSDVGSLFEFLHNRNWVGRVIDSLDPIPPNSRQFVLNYEKDALGRELRILRKHETTKVP